MDFAGNLDFAGITGQLARMVAQEMIIPEQVELVDIPGIGRFFKAVSVSAFATPPRCDESSLLA